MKLALIPPKGYELSVLDGSAVMSLCIPSFYGSAAWSGAVRQTRMQAGEYFHILDNGAAEGEIADIETLINYGLTLNVDEMIVPDVLGDCEGTIKACQEFFAAAPLALARFKWMGVLQGKNEEEMIKVALSYVRNPTITTVGIPRNYINATNQLNARIDLATRIHNRFPGRFEIHFLGAHYAWPGEIRALAKHTHGRSLDTSLPFNATIAGIELNDRTRMIKRPPYYFTERRALDRDLLQKNIHTVKEWANGRRASTSAPVS